MIPATCKRLIEVDFPIAKVSEHSAKEKSIRYGHPSTLHLWWARRPLAACRAVLMGLLLPDPCDAECPNDFKAKARRFLAQRSSKPSAKDEDLRQLLLDFIGEFADWEHAANSTYLEIGRGLVRAAHSVETPVVVDPFSGGGSIPLEALRLGCEAFASDLNPVACLILKTLLEDIPRYGNADFKLPGKDGKEVVVQGLANALRHVGNQVKEAAKKELARFYPTDTDGSRPIAYLWARTVRCEGIGCGAEIPLMRSFWLSKRNSSRRGLRYRVQRPKGKLPLILFEVFEPDEDKDLPNSTVNRANATCLCCNTVLPAERVRAQLSEQNGGADVVFDKSGNRSGGARLLVVVTVHDNLASRQYRLPTDEDYKAIWAAQKAVRALPDCAVPTEAIPTTELRRIALPIYGVKSWGDMYTARQKLAMATLTKIINSLAATTDASKAVNRFAGLALSRFSDISNAFCQWENTKTQVRHVFTRQAIAMLWDFAEPDLFGDNAGDYGTTLETMARVVEKLLQFDWPTHGRVERADAAGSPLPKQSANIWFTDPPYYDSVPYAHLSDFFYVWLKRVATADARSWFESALTSKDNECVVDRPHSLSDSKKTPEYYEAKMAEAMREGRRVLQEDGLGCVVFAHKTTEGWESLLSGMLKAGFVITASWPITTEMATRSVARDTAALAGSVHLVCRPRSTDAGIGDWTEVKKAMEKRIREWLPTLTKHGIRGADAIFSCLGPALESYSRYDKVLTAADREVPLGGDADATEPEQRGFLAYVFETLSKEALHQVLGDAETEGFEEDSRMTALFLWTLQTTKASGNGATKNKVEAGEEESGEEDEPKKDKAGFTMPFDTFIRITRPMGIHYVALENRVIEIDKGVVRLLPVSERSEQLLGEAAKRPGIEISLEDVKQLELGLVTKRRDEATLANAPKRGKKAPVATSPATAEAEFTTIDRLHRAMLLFSLGRSTVLRQVLEKEMSQNQRFERLALALNALYPDGSDERRMLEGVQAAMRGIR
jgi:adenine-specific DNA methylase